MGTCALHRTNPGFSMAVTSPIAQPFQPTECLWEPILEVRSGRKTHCLLVVTQVVAWMAVENVQSHLCSSLLFQGSLAMVPPCAPILPRTKVATLARRSCKGAFVTSSGLTSLTLSRFQQTSRAAITCCHFGGTASRRHKCGHSVPMSPFLHHELPSWCESGVYCSTSGPMASCLFGKQCCFSK